MSHDDQQGDKPGSGLFSGLRRAFGRDRKRTGLSEEDLKDIVTDNDELLDDEKRMIGEILDLDELTVRDIMTPRVDIIAVEENETVRAAVERIQGTGYSRLPVYSEDLDHIRGIVHVKDLLDPLLDDHDDDPVSEYAYGAMFVPESKDLFPLLSEMQTNRQQMAVVVDEYGGTDGLITVEDIVEEIVGEIGDETDIDDGSLVTKVAENEWLVDGRLPVEEAQEMGWPVEESDQYDTIAGWLLDALDVVPQLGAVYETGGYRFKVQNMRRRRVRLLRVTKLQQDAASAVAAPVGEDDAKAGSEQ
ncbi:MAG: hemolysin family protein [Eggerthellaceae bacterium]|jgi:putative hemolysin